MKKICFLSLLVALTHIFVFSSLVAAENTVPLPPLKVTIAEKYGLAVIQNAPQNIDDEAATNLLRQAHAKWKFPLCQIAWFDSAGKIVLVGEASAAGEITLLRPKKQMDAIWLEKALGYPTTPTELSAAFLENGVLAHDNFSNKVVIFKAEVSEIARGAFNKPYVFFQGSDPFIGLTCYFDPNDVSLRRIRKNSQVVVRGMVKEFLMQDVILQDCSILSILPDITAPPM